MYSSLKIVDERKDISKCYNLDTQGRQFPPAVKMIPATRLTEQTPRKIRWDHLKLNKIEIYLYVTVMHISYVQ